MKNLLISLMLLCSTLSLNAQTEPTRVGVSKENFASNLLSDVIQPVTWTPDTLLANAYISNVQFQGDANQFGVFTNGENSIQLNNGFVISTGNVQSGAGPNSAANISTNYNSTTLDADLSKIPINRPYFDAGILEFDIVADCQELEIEYVFASEEYCEYTQTLYTDLLGIFISGPGIVDTFTNNATNAATVSETGEYISAETVNWQKNKAAYVTNVPFDAALNNCTFSELLAETPYKSFIEYDGFTVPLSAKVATQVGETYHVKIAIADTQDKIYDSSIFFKIKEFENNVCCPDTLIVADIATPNTYRAAIRLESDATVSNSGYVKFNAGKVIALKHGFNTQNNSQFQAKITPCPTYLDQLPITSPQQTNSLFAKIEESKPKLINDNISLKVFPNPSNGLTYIRFELPENQQISVAVFDVNGRLIQQLKSNAWMPKGVNTLNFNASNFEKGIYFVALNSEIRNTYQKLVVH